MAINARGCFTAVLITNSPLPRGCFLTGRGFVLVLPFLFGPPVVADFAMLQSDPVENRVCCMLSGNTSRKRCLFEAFVVWGLKVFPEMFFGGWRFRGIWKPWRIKCMRIPPGVWCARYSHDDPVQITYGANNGKENAFLSHEHIHKFASESRSCVTGSIRPDSAFPGTKSSYIANGGRQRPISFFAFPTSGSSWAKRTRTAVTDRRGADRLPRNQR